MVEDSKGSSGVINFAVRRCLTFKMLLLVTLFLIPWMILAAKTMQPAAEVELDKVLFIEEANVFLFIDAGFLNEANPYGSLRGCTVQLYSQQEMAL